MHITHYKLQYHIGRWKIQNKFLLIIISKELEIINVVLQTFSFLIFYNNEVMYLLYIKFIYSVDQAFFIVDITL